MKKFFLSIFVMLTLFASTAATAATKPHFPQSGAHSIWIDGASGKRYDVRTWENADGVPNAAFYDAATGNLVVQFFMVGNRVGDVVNSTLSVYTPAKGWNTISVLEDRALGTIKVSFLLADGSMQTYFASIIREGVILFHESYDTSNGDLANEQIEWIQSGPPPGPAQYLYSDNWRLAWVDAGYTPPVNRVNY